MRFFAAFGTTDPSFSAGGLREARTAGLFFFLFFCLNMEDEPRW